MQSYRIDTILSFRVVDARNREPFKRDKCVWYTNDSKKDTKTGSELFKVRTVERISMNLDSRAIKFQANVIVTSRWV